MPNFFDNIKEGVNDFIFSLTTNDRYATSRSPYNANHLNSSLNAYQRTSSNANFISNSNNASTLSLDAQGNGNVGYRPGLRSRATNDGEIQLNDYGNAPPMHEIWERIDKFLAEEYPELVEFLNEPATAADLNELENDINISLPADVRESYQIHDGQERGGKPTGVINGLTLLDLESIAEEYSVWQTAARKIEYERRFYLEKLHAYKQQMAQLTSAASSSEDRTSKLVHKKIQPPVPRIDFVAHQRSFPEGAIQPVYVHAGWVPLVKDFSGNNIAVDLAPGPKGKWGQIICFGHDFDIKFVVANSWSEFLHSVVTGYEKGNFYIDDVEEELWYAINGRPLNYLDELKKTHLAPLRAQRKPRIVNRSANSSIPNIASTSQFPATRLGSTSTTNVVLPKETLIEPEKELEKDSEKESVKSVEATTEASSDDAEAKDKVKDSVIETETEEVPLIN